MKILHVLCTDQVDYLYLLAANVSLTAFSARKHTTVCLVDRQTSAFAAASGFRLEDWADEVIVVDVPFASPSLNSRYLKTTARFHLAGDFLFLDLDAIVVRAELFRRLRGDCLAASQNVDHNNINHPGDRFPDDIGEQIYKPLGWEHPFLPYVNSGVLFCRDNPRCHALFQKWHQLWNEQRQKVGIHLDQPALNQALRELPGSLTLMPPTFNSPVDVGPKYEVGAWVYHYYISIFSGKPRPDSLLGVVAREIQQSGPINPGVLRFLLRQKRAFFPEFSCY